MRTEKQIEASRRNGVKSRGPLTPRLSGDAAYENTAYNALADVIVHHNESRRGFIALCLFLRQHIQPVNAIEHLIVGRIAAAHWRQLRYWRMEREAATRLVSEPANPARQAAQPGIDTRNEQRLDITFFRAVVTLYRVRIAEKRISGEKSVSLMKTLGRMQKLQPGRHPRETRPNLTENGISHDITPAEVATLLTPDLLQSFYGMPVGQGQDPDFAPK